jgi:hypothetical protein
MRSTRHFAYHQGLGLGKARELYPLSVDFQVSDGHPLASLRPKRLVGAAEVLDGTFALGIIYRQGDKPFRRARSDQGDRVGGEAVEGRCHPEQPWFQEGDAGS